MFTSMTGFGRGSSGKNNETVEVLTRVYNGRYLEMKIRGLSQSPEIESKVREKISKSLIRGTVHVSMENNQNNSKENLSFNRQRYEAVEKIIYQIQKDYGRSLELSSILSFDDLFLNSNENELKEKNVLKALDEALNQVQIMRCQEGMAIYNDTLERVTQLSNMAKDIEKFSNNYTKHQKENLKQKLDALLDSAGIDEQRIAQEAAFLADRSDISEEMVRITSHITQFTQLIEEEEAVGKRLTFLLQELGREINTIGSKMGTGDIINIVVNFKNQLEKIREQVQNIL